MKISLICVCVFLFCTIYWAFGLSQILTSAENAVPSTSTSASDLLANNFTDTTSSNSERYQTVLKSEGDLDTNLDLTKKLDQIPKNEDEGLKQEYVFLDGVSQNSGVAHEVIGPSSGIIHTLVDSRTLQEKADHSGTADYTSHHNKTSHLGVLEGEKSQDLVNSENETIKQNLTVEVKLETGEEGVNVSDNTQQTEDLGTQVPTAEPKINATSEKDETPEDIPSFSEWTQKQLEEAEKKKEEANSSIQNQNSNGKPNLSNRKRWKNYASPDCGAKIIAANPESNSAGSVLTASRDEYKLNACTNRIWFVVELCEAIQAKRIELANFELFSSSPKDFSISVSDRFPTRDWSSVGQFTAKDERDIQSFDLYPHLFGKYIKFEMHSHHGSEHYCPISLFRVFGTSEFEVLETENQVHANTVEDEGDDDDDPIHTMDNGDAPKNLFSSATDAVISIVKKAAEVLGNKGNASNSKDQENITVIKYTPLISTCTTPSHIVVCNNCSDLLFGKVYELLSCNSKSLARLVLLSNIKHILYKTNLCSSYGLEFCSGLNCSIENPYKSYIDALFPQKLIAALCNIVAINECKVVRNISTNATSTAQPQTNDSKSIDSKIPNLAFTEDLITNAISSSSDVDKTVAQEKTLIETEYTSQIKPTRTLTSDIDMFPIDSTVNIKLSTHNQEVHLTETLATPSVQNDSVVVSDNQSVTHKMEHIEVSSEVVPDIETSTESAEHLEDHLDSLVSDEESSNVASSTLSPPVLPQGQKESVFLRLSNRIKALERNMSLSSQYLEELSRRYKKQVEEMQRLLDKTINTLNEENKKKEERTQHLEEQIVMLRESINLLIEDKKAWMNTTYWLFLSGVVIVGILLFCRRNQEQNQSTFGFKSTSNQVWRRMSVDAITNKTPVKKRRPSEEALLIGGTYTDLMIDELDSSQRLKSRKRKKKKQLQRSHSITTLNEEVIDSDSVQRTVHSEKEYTFLPTSESTVIWRRQSTIPANNTTQWSDNVTKNSFTDTPFVLDESEHSAIEPLPYLKEQPNVNAVNGDNIKENGVIRSPSFFKTAADSRAKRSLQNSIITVASDGHKKSASFDESVKLSLSSAKTTDSTSLNSFDESGKLIELPKKEKKSALKRLFKSLNFK